jgi:protein-tyrosine phosphatase
MNIDPTEIEMTVDPIRQRMSGYAVHGNTPFDVPFISQIEGNLWQGGCENGLVLPRFIENVVSLYPWELYHIEHQLKSFLTVWMSDNTDQGFGQVDSIARWVNERCEDGPTLVYCQAGLNRSSLVVARALMLRGMNGSAAMALIRERRSPACLCNPAFAKWLLSVEHSTE